MYENKLSENKQNDKGTKMGYLTIKLTLHGFSTTQNFIRMERRDYRLQIL